RIAGDIDSDDRDELTFDPLPGRGGLSHSLALETARTLPRVPGKLLQYGSLVQFRLGSLATLCASHGLGKEWPFPTLLSRSGRRWSTAVSGAKPEATNLHMELPLSAR